jgi:peptidoglycan/xylan/chitin deacetylase (PgdA/CDA1 family)
VIQVIAIAAAWLSLFGAMCRAATLDHPGALIPGALLIAFALWGVDAFVPALSPWAVRRGPPAPAGSAPRVALTFDDGPSSDTSAVLRALAAEGVKATFFMLGRHIEQWPEVARAVAAAGHAVGNHTYSHRVLSLCLRREVEREVDATQALLPRETRLFRAPRGFQGPVVRAVLRARGLRLIGWTRGAWDSERRTAQEIARAATARPRDGDILLLHDGAGTRGEQRRGPTAEAVADIVRAYRASGFRFVTLPELLDVSSARPAAAAGTAAEPRP